VTFLSRVSSEPVPGCFVLSLFYSFVLVVYSSSLSLLICFLLAGFHGGRFGLEISKHDITYELDFIFVDPEVLSYKLSIQALLSFINK
jgi:hypothetical protein